MMSKLVFSSPLSPPDAQELMGAVGCILIILCPALDGNVGALGRGICTSQSGKSLVPRAYLKLGWHGYCQELGNLLYCCHVAEPASAGPKTEQT